MFYHNKPKLLKIYKNVLTKWLILVMIKVTMV